LASNNNSGGTTDSHIALTLPASTSVTHYIVFRERELQRAHFSVDLNGTRFGGYYACKVDSDCVAISKGGCCPNGWKVAVNKSQVSAYNSIAMCAIEMICPLSVINDTRVAECNTA